MNRLFNDSLLSHSFICHMEKKHFQKCVSLLLNVPEGSEFQFPALILKEAKTHLAETLDTNRYAGVRIKDVCLLLL